MACLSGQCPGIKMEEQKISCKNNPRRCTGYGDYTSRASLYRPWVIDKRSIKQYTDQVLGGFYPFGTLEITNAVNAWGQTDAAFTVTVNNAETDRVNLYPDGDLKWEGPHTGDIRLVSIGSDSYILIADKPNGIAPADFTFTITKAGEPANTIKGTVTVKTEYDITSAGISSIKSYFENYVGYSDTLTAVTPITKWGQDDVAYTITGGERAVIWLVGVDYDGTFFEWKPPVIDGKINARIDTYYGNSRYELATDSTAKVEVEFPFRITNNADIERAISGKVMVSLKHPTRAELTPSYLHS